MPKVADLYIEIGAKLDNFEKGMKSFQKQTGRMEKGLARVTKRIIALGLAYFGARGIAKIGKSFLEVARTVEQYDIRLKTLLGSQKQATVAMGHFEDIASRLPFTLEQVIESGIRLTTIKVPFTDWLEPIADVASAFGLDLPTATDQFARAMSAGLGAADWFREKGITAMIRDFAKLKFGIDDLAKEGTGKLQEVMFEWTKQFQGSSQDMAKTWDGIVSMLQDKWFKFRKAVMDSKVFQLLKEGLASFNEKLDEFIEAGKMEEWAKNTAIAVLKFFEWILEGLQGVVVGFLSFKAALLKLPEDINAFFEKITVSEDVKKIENSLSDLQTELGKIIGMPEEIVPEKKTFEDFVNQISNVQSGFTAAIAKIRLYRAEVEGLDTSTKAGTEDLALFSDTVSENLAPAMSNYANLLNMIIPATVQVGEEAIKTGEKQINIFNKVANAMTSGITGVMNVLKQFVIGEFLKYLATAKMPFLAKLALLLPTVAAVEAAFGAIKGFQYEGVAHAPTMAMIAEREPERVIKESTFQRMRGEVGGGMNLTVAPVFTISAIDAEGVREFMRNKGLQEIVEGIKAGVQKPELKSALGVG